jgi:2'-5' RNA ligase
MDYAIVLYFDEKLEKDINSLIVNVSDGCGNNYMVEHSIPPHITVSLFHKENNNIEQIIKLLDKNIFKINRENICIASIGVFNPSVLFIVPVINTYLLESNTEITRLLSNFTDIDFDKNYIFNQWVPHISIAVKLTDKELQKAFEIIKNEFKNIEGEINRIALVECNPYKEIKVWKL